MSMKRALIGLIGAVTLLGGPAVRPAAGQAFEVWVAGGALDQSTKDIDPVTPGVQPPHSKLVGNAGAATWVSDTRLGGAAMGGRAVANGASCIWAFAECFGGGMFDELNANGATQALTSAARFSEKSYYPKKVIAGGVDCDWADAYVDSIAPAVTALMMATAAANADPWGPAVLPPSPPAPAACGARGVEFLREHPQWRAAGAGAPGLLLDTPPGAGRLAIFWCGDPSWPDEEQIGFGVASLLAMGWNGNDIYILFRNGKVPTVAAGGTIAATLGAAPALVPAAHVNAATNCRLTQLFALKYGGGQPNPSLLFFFANDHGSTTDPTLRRQGISPGESTPQGGYEEEDPFPSDQPDWPGGGDHDWSSDAVSLGGACIDEDQGACCLGNGVCTVTTSNDCASMSGLYGGDGSVCPDDAPPVDLLVDPFNGPCLVWVPEFNDQTDNVYAQFIADEYVITELIPATGGPAGTEASFSRAIAAPASYEAQLQLDWSMSGADRIMVVDLVLNDADGNEIARTGLEDLDAGGPPVARAAIDGSGDVTGVTAPLSGAGSLRLEVEECGAASRISAKVNGQLLLTRSTPRVATELEIQVQSTSAGQFESVALDHLTFGAITPCLPDIDRDGTVGFADLLAMLGQWAACPACPADLDCDGNVGFADLLILLGWWGPC